MGTKSERLENWYREVWQDGDIDAIGRYFAPDAAASGLVPNMVFSPDEFGELVVVVRQMVGEIRTLLHHCLEDGDWLAALIEIQTTCLATGGSVRVHGQVLVRFDGEMMVEAYNVFDFLSFFEQMNQLPPNSLPILLSGATLR